MFLCLEYTEVGDDTLHFCKGAQLKPLSWCCRWIKAFIMSTQALNVKLIKCSERWTFHVSWWTLEQLSSGFFWKNVHLWGKRNPAELNWESPLHRVCFVYFTAHLITPAVNICLYASSQVFMTRRRPLMRAQRRVMLRLFFPRLDDKLPPTANSLAPGLSFDHHTYWYVHVFAGHTLYETPTVKHAHIHTQFQNHHHTHTRTHTRHHYHQKSFLKRAAVICKSNN